MNTQPKSNYIKNTNIACVPRGISYSLNCMPPLWAAHKVLLGDMQILENYPHCYFCLLHDINASCCQICRLHTQVRTHTKFIFYNITNTPTCIVCLYSLWIKLRSYRYIKLIRGAFLGHWQQNREALQKWMAQYSWPPRINQNT